MNAIYFDYNATCPIRPEVIQVMSETMARVGNASSVHGAGREARKRVEAARKQVATLANTQPSRVIFNSGATEANNTVLKAYDPDKVWISAIEHSSVREVVAQARQIAVTAEGVVDLGAFEQALQQAERRGELPDLISVMYVNSETGAIQPLAEIIALAKIYDIPVHCDAVQAAGRIPVDMDGLGLDFMSLSSHKMGGPQGVGALIVGRCAEAPRFIDGGTQENFKRAGTENVAGIVGMGQAAEMALAGLADYGRITSFRDRLQDGMLAAAPGMKIFAKAAPRVGNTLNIAWPGKQASMLLMNLDLEGVAVSTGSACSSGSMKPSQVLTAMGASEEEAAGALRISLGWNTKEDEIERFLEIWQKIAQRVA